MGKAALPSAKQLYWLDKLASELPLTPEQEQVIQANYVPGMTAKTASWLLDTLFAISDQQKSDLTPGLYEHEGQPYLVVQAQKSGKPYAMALECEFIPAGKAWHLSYEHGKGKAASITHAEKLPIEVGGPYKTAAERAAAVGALYETWQLEKVVMAAEVG